MNQVKKKHIFFILFIFSTAINAQKTLDQLLQYYNDESIPYIKAEKLKDSIDKVILLDAREQIEYKVSHIKNAIPIGYKFFRIDTIINKNLPKDRTIVVYCSLGIRSEVISKKLKKAGYTSIYNLYGGIFEWKNKDFPVVDTTGVETEKIHVFSKKWEEWLLKGIKIY